MLEVNRGFHYFNKETVQFKFVEVKAAYYIALNDQN
jgi:hypothetical protein